MVDVDPFGLDAEGRKPVALGCEVLLIGGASGIPDKQRLTKVGIADLGTVESRDDAVAALTELQPPEADLPTRSTDARAELPGWQRLIAAEARWESADWMCRAATYNAHVDDVAAAVTEFEEQHAAEIVQARQGWINIRAKAEELGYQAGVYGPVGVP